MLVLGSAACMLISCGNMPSITIDEAKARANEIMERQDNPQVFTLPNNFIFEYKQNGWNESLIPESGYQKMEQTDNQSVMVDVNKLASRYYTKSSANNYSNELEVIEYYDNNSGIRYELKNQNGYKTRNEFSSSKDEAEIYFEGYRNMYENIIKWHSDSRVYPPITLDTYSTKMDYYQKKHETLKDEKDQYCNVYVGSDNVKSLQTKIESKEKNTESDYSGYIESTFNCFVREDKFDKCETTTTIDSKYDKDNHFYRKSDIKQNYTITYGNANINIPNPQDYIK